MNGQRTLALNAGECTANVASGRARSAELVDLDWAFVETGRAQMRETGACEIPGFVRPEALAAFIDDARRSRPGRTAAAGLGTVYLGFPDESFPPDHPQQWLGDYDVGAVAYDLFPADSPIRRLYEWDELTRVRRRDPRTRRRSTRTPIRSARSTSR